MKAGTTYSLPAGQTLAALAPARPATPPRADNDVPRTVTIERGGFLRLAISGFNWQIQAGEMARRKTCNDDMRRLAGKIIFDHVDAAVRLGMRLEARPQDAGTLPPAELVPKHERMLRQLEAAPRGPAFDALYLAMQTEEHIEAIALFRAYAGAGEDRGLAGFARETLPGLIGRLVEATGITTRRPSHISNE